jgi:hypothetical protein
MVAGHDFDVHIGYISGVTTNLIRGLLGDSSFVRAELGCTTRTESGL